MADQGALGRTHDTPTSSSYNAATKHYLRPFPGTFFLGNKLLTRVIVANTAYLRQQWHYVRAGARHSRFNSNLIGATRETLVNSAALRAKPAYVRRLGSWQDTTQAMPMYGDPADIGRGDVRFWPMLTQFTELMRTDGSITGVITDGGTPQANVEVVLMWRPLMIVIGYTRTNASGVYLFTELDPTQTAKYAVLAFDPEGGNANNIGRLDRLTPG